LTKCTEGCAACGEVLRIIACIEDPAVIEKILAHLGAQAARPPPSCSIAFASLLRKIGRPFTRPARAPLTRTRSHRNAGVNGPRKAAQSPATAPWTLSLLSLLPRLPPRRR
jgi:hypothetical protein